MKVTLLLTFFVLIVALSGCVTTPQQMTMTPLEIQTLQSRKYDFEKSIVFRSVVSVFQDIGYTITNADLETGLISAESSSNSDFGSKFWLGVTKVSQTKATAFIEEIGDKTNARLNFVETEQTSSGYGQTDRQDTPILDAKLYENAFEKIENAIFVRNNSSPGSDR